MNHLTHDEPDPPWEEWIGPLTQATDDILHSFLLTLLDLEDIPDSAMLITQLGLSARGLGI